MKIYAYVALAIVLIAGLKLAYSSTYDAGFNAAVVRQSELIQVAKDEAVAIARHQWENAARIAADNIVTEERIVEVERIIEKRIPQIVERIVTVTPECNDLGAEFVSLLNAQVHSGSGGSDNSSDAAAESQP
jgi:hypothetical protein